jgi:hypothetical protein
LLTACTDGFGQADREELARLRIEVKLLRDESAVRPTRVSKATELKGNAEYQMLPIITGEQNEALMAHQIKRDAAEIIIGFVQSKYADAKHIRLGSLESDNTGLLRQKAAFYSKGQGDVVAFVDVNFKTSPPIIVREGLIRRDGIMVNNNAKYQVVSAE